MTTPISIPSGQAHVNQPHYTIPNNSKTILDQGGSFESGSVNISRTTFFYDPVTGYHADVQELFEWKKQADGTWTEIITTTTIDYDTAPPTRTVTSSENKGLSEGSAKSTRDTIWSIWNDYK